ncbi:unnamed protein product, partial [Nesidiocoris tenuis]
LYQQFRQSSERFSYHSERTERNSGTPPNADPDAHRFDDTDRRRKPQRSSGM